MALMQMYNCINYMYLYYAILDPQANLKLVYVHY